MVTIFLEVHRRLGLGLPARCYGDAVAIELRQREVIYERDVPFNIAYDGRKIETGETIDFIIENIIVLTVVAREATGQLEKEQVNAKLRFTGMEIGFLVNFHKADLRQGIRRLVVGRSAPEVPHRREPGLQGPSSRVRLPERKRKFPQAAEASAGEHARPDE